MTYDGSTPFRVGEWRAYPTEDRLENSARRIAVDSRAMQVLVYLARHSNRPVAVDELSREIWGSVFSSSAVVENCIGRLRDALGDAPDDTHYIESLPSAYRLIAPVQALPGDAADSLPVMVSAEEQPVTYIRLLSELNRRKVFRAAAAYAVLAWVILQIAETTFAPLGFPAWTMRTLIIMMVVGFPVVLVMSWIFEVRPGGVFLDPRDWRVTALSTNSSEKRFDFVLVSSLVVLSLLGAYVLINDEGAGSPGPDSSTGLPPGRSAPAKSIAVLAFDNFSSAPENAFFADGLADEVLTLLSQFEQLAVASRTSAFAFKDSKLDIKTIAERLNVQFVLEGSVARDGDNIRVNAQLIDTTTGYHLWSGKYDRELRDVFAVQAQLANSVAKELKIALSVTDEQRFTLEPTNNTEAYIFYLRARDYMRQPFSDKTLASAENLFQRAIDIDPRYASAYAGLCDALLAQYVLTSTVTFFDRAERACHRSLSLNEKLPEVRVSLATLYRHFGRYDEAEAELQKALTMDPLSADASQQLGEVLMRQKRLDEAEEAFQRAVDLRPSNYDAYAALSNFYYQNQRYEEAAKYSEKVVLLTPDSARTHSTLGASYYMLGDYEKAAAAYQLSLDLAPTRAAYTNTGLMYYYLGRFDDAVYMQKNAVQLAPDDHRVWGRLAESYRFVKSGEAESQKAYRKALELAQNLLTINPNDWNTLGHLALYYAHTGNADKAYEMIDRAVEIAADDPTAHYFSALVSIELGDTEKTLQELQKAVQLGFSRSMIQADPDLEALRNEERYKAMMLQGS